MESPIRVEVKAEVPAASSGRLLDALTDIIRPFAERRGLKADQIRLQREEVALKIMEMAQRRIAEQGAPIRPIPTKGLVHLLEQASLEDPDDETMVRMWAGLLEGAATVDSTNLPRLVGILSEMNRAQALLLEQIITHGKPIDNPQGTVQLDGVRQWASPGSVLAEVFDLDGDIDADLVAGAILHRLATTGVAIEDSEVIAPDGTFLTIGRDAIEAAEGMYCDEDQEIDYDILESLGLIRAETISRASFEDHGFSVHWYRITPLGIELYVRCNPDKWNERVAEKWRREDSAEATPSRVQ